MPGVINGIGTWYWGKRNIHSEIAGCEFCGNLAELQSYDTTLYIVFVFIPVLPIGKKRVINQCPSCDRHRVMKLKEWNQNKIKSIEEAIQSFQNEPNKENLKHTMGILMGFQDRESFQELSEMVAELPNLKDPDVFSSMGSGYEMFGELAKAETAYRNSLAIKEDPHIRNILGRVLLIQDKPDEARKLLEKILEEKNVDTIGFLFLLVEGYQAQGRHDQALEVLDACKEAFSQIESDASLKAEWQKYQKTSNKYRAKGKKVKSKNLLKPKIKFKKSSLTSHVPKIIALGFLAFLLLGYLASAIEKGEKRKVYLVNGLKHPYKVSINGKELEISHNNPWPVEVPEGQTVVKVLDKDLKIADQTFTIETSFFLRPFDDLTFVINPDQAAILIYQETKYFPKNSPPPSANAQLPPNKFYTGKGFYRFEDLDYEFVLFPQQPSGQGITTKNRIGLYRGDYQQTWGILQKYFSPQQSKDFLKKQLFYAPENTTYLFLLSKFTKPEEFIAFLKKGLAVRPVLVDWHRYYQVGIVQLSPEYDVHKEYLTSLEKEPNNADLMFLVGQVMPDLNKEIELYEKAIKQSPPSLNAHYSLAWQYLSEGHFEKVLQLVEKIKTLSPKDDKWNKVYLEALSGLGKNEEALQFVRKMKQKGVNQYLRGEEIVLKEIQFLNKMGKFAQAQEVASLSYKQMMNSPYAAQNQDYIEASKLSLQTYQMYCEQKIPLYRQLLKKSEEDVYLFRLAICEERLAVATEHAKAGKVKNAYDFLLLYILAKTQQKEALASEYLKEATELLGKGMSPSEKVLASSLLQKGPLPPSEILLRLPLKSDKKRQVLVALGFQFPAQRAQYFKLAKKLNYDLGFPYLFIKKVLSENK